MNFAFNVIDEEFPNMEHMKLSRRTPESFSQVFNKMEHLNPKTPFQIQLVAGMFNHLNELATYRGLRTSSIEAELSPYMWLPISWVHSSLLFAPACLILNTYACTWHLIHC